MIVRTRSGRRRCGATTVEVSIVLSVFLMFLFGIFEYCRFLMMIQVTTNAARDGARYAVVNIGKPSNFDTVDYNDGNTPPKVYSSVRKYVNFRMAGTDGMIDGYAVQVFPCQQSNLELPVPLVTLKTPTTDEPVINWNTAKFGERIAVRITGTYRTILPNFLMFGAGGIPIDVVVTMGSEG